MAPANKTVRRPVNIPTLAPRGQPSPAVDKALADVKAKLDASQQIEAIVDRLAEIQATKRDMRECGRCGVRDIPRGVDWPNWVDGKPAHNFNYISQVCVPVRNPEGAR